MQFLLDLQCSDRQAASRQWRNFSQYPNALFHSQSSSRIHHPAKHTILSLSLFPPPPHTKESSIVENQLRWEKMVRITNERAVNFQPLVLFYSQLDGGVQPVQSTHSAKRLPNNFLITWSMQGLIKRQTTKNSRQQVRIPHDWKMLSFSQQLPRSWNRDRRAINPKQKINKTQRKKKLFKLRQ